jgi:hypothetical protein
LNLKRVLPVGRGAAFLSFESEEAVFEGKRGIFEKGVVEVGDQALIQDLVLPADIVVVERTFSTLNKERLPIFLASMER